MTERPLCLRLQGRLCLVVGGGSVGLRRARALLQAGATVRIVSPSVSNEDGLDGAQIVRRTFRPSDLDGCFLAVAATDERDVNAFIVREARARGALVNVADRPQDGDVTFPALLRRGDLVVSVSTGGGSPALGALARNRIAQALGDEWGGVLDIAAALRRKSLTPSADAAYNSEVLQILLEGGLLTLVAHGDTEAIDRLLVETLGEGYTLAELELSMPKGKK